MYFDLWRCIYEFRPLWELYEIFHAAKSHINTSGKESERLISGVCGSPAAKLLRSKYCERRCARKRVPIPYDKLLHLR